MFPVEIFQTTLSKLTVILHRYDIRFHLTGGLTGTAYGEPRMTQDIDVVVDPNQLHANIESVLNDFINSDWMFDEQSVRNAVETRGMFQLLDAIESLKLDVYTRELVRGELDRSVLLEVFEGEFLPVVARPDAVVSKLVWISKGSHKSRRDLRAIYRNASIAEKQQIAVLASSFDLSQLLDDVLSESDEIE